MDVRHRARSFAPGLVPLVVAALIVAVFTAVSGRSADGGPRPLRLAGGGSSEAPAVESLAADARSDAAGSRYRLDGALPGGDPDGAPVYHLDSMAAADTVRALAEAFELTAPTRQEDGAWVAQGERGMLRVEGTAGMPWTFTAGAPCWDAPSATGPDAPVSSAETTSVAVCATSGGISEPAVPPIVSGSEGAAAAAPQVDPAPPSSGPAGQDVAAPAPQVAPAEPAPAPVSVAEARAAAAPVLAALGLDAKSAVPSGGDGGFLTVNPIVDGMRTSGYATTIHVTAVGAEFAGGWLATPRAGEAYPLVSARTAFDQLEARNGASEVAPLLCRLPEDGSQGCAPEPERVVTGAELGLMLSWEDDAPLLVPAWLFSIHDQPQPLATVAVSPQYLAGPDTAPSADPATSDGGTVGPAPGTGSGTPGWVGGSPPVPEPAPEPLPRPGLVAWEQPRMTGAGTLTVTVYGSSTCPPVQDTPLVEESDTRVVVSLRAAVHNGFCTMDLAPHDVTVDVAVDARELVDGATGQVHVPDNGS